MEAAKELYSMLEGRVDGFAVLAHALREANQSRAYLLLTGKSLNPTYRTNLNTPPTSSLQGGTGVFLQNHDGRLDIEIVGLNDSTLLISTPDLQVTIPISFSSKQVPIIVIIIIVFGLGFLAGVVTGLTWKGNQKETE